MKCLYLCFSILLINFQIGFGQQLELQFQLVDELTEEPISDAHVFINGSSVGTISNAQGMCEMNIARQETQTLLISHIAYETLVIDAKRYSQLLGGVVVKMKPNGVDITEFQITAKRSNKWKKNFRRFRRALLGEGEAASKCKILNPETLRFEERDKGLFVTARDQLQIENDYLGYRLQFLLKELHIKTDGSRYYKGNVHFIDKLETGDNGKKRKRRETVYQNSLAHFLRSLMQNPDKEALKEQGYEISIEQYKGGKFTTLISPEPRELIRFDSISGFYQLYFSEFLTIKHKNLLENKNAEYQVAVSTAEQQKFGAAPSQSMGSRRQVAVSRLYKIKPFLLFDVRGNIINKSDLKEYNYWANQRLATTLPIDYKKFSDFDLPRLSKFGTSSIDTLLIFKQLVGIEKQKQKEAIATLNNNWTESYIAPLLDILRLSGDKWLQKEISALLKKNVPDTKTEYYDGIQWLWKREPNYGNYYANFKAHLYRAIDTVFYKYFIERQQESKIRLDEIVWGGVKQDGIPPLHSPKMIKAVEASYLSDSDVVFGIEINGYTFAYPKRILAWHEMFTDDIRGQSIAGVYCTLCGTLIIYNTEVDGRKHELGTSGFLYRSNKLMYDKATQSLWSTMLGQPVVGPLVKENIELATLPVETTTWKKWRGRHPQTKVLSLETGYDRNYAEGEAYKTYFADDALMFPVPKQDLRLPNKARVFIPRTEQYKDYPLAIAVDYLKQKRIHQDQIGKQHVLILTERNGASKAFEIGHQQFQSYKKGLLLDNKKQIWKVTESAILGPNGVSLARIPAHESFWFAWVNVFPNTRVVF